MSTLKRPFGPDPAGLLQGLEPWAKSGDLGVEGAQSESPGYVEVSSMIPGSDAFLFLVLCEFCLL